MKLVTQTDVLSKHFGDKEAIRILSEAGYDGIDYSMFCMDNDDNILNSDDFEKYVEELKKAASYYGLTFEQSHAPFPPFRLGDDEFNKKKMPKVERALIISGMLGVKCCVVHPSAAGENQYDLNMRYYESLIPIAQKYGIKIALENMWGREQETRKIIPNICSVPEDFNRYVDSLDPQFFTACLDLGHCGLVGCDAADMIRAMGNRRVTSLHIHDNNNLEDSHTLPYLSKMNWDSILKALGEIDYQGNFTYEADNFLKGFPDALLPECVKFMARVGRYMMNEIEKYRVAK